MSRYDIPQMLRETDRLLRRVDELQKQLEASQELREECQGRLDRMTKDTSLSKQWHDGVAEARKAVREQDREIAKIEPEFLDLALSAAHRHADLTVPQQQAEVRCRTWLREQHPDLGLSDIYFLARELVCAGWQEPVSAMARRAGQRLVPRGLISFPLIMAVGGMGALLVVGLRMTPQLMLFWGIILTCYLLCKRIFR